MFTIKFYKSFPDSESSLDWVISATQYEKRVQCGGQTSILAYDCWGRATMYNVDDTFLDTESFAVAYIENQSGKTIDVIRA